MSIKQELRELQANLEQQLPPELVEKIDKVTADFEQQGLGDKALKVGDTLPDASLSDQNGNSVTLSTLLSKGPTIISFYRGGWCPFCNLELRAYQDLLGDIKGSGGQLIAVTSEKPDNSLSTIEKNELAFPVLTDAGNAFAKAVGIAYEFPEELIAMYRDSFGLDLPGINDQSGWSLAIPATYVVDQNGRIVLASVERDYRTRSEPSEALAALQTVA